MKVNRDTVALLALMLIGVMIGIALNVQWRSGRHVHSSSPAATAAPAPTNTRPASPTPAERTESGETISHAASPTPAEVTDSERAPAETEWGVVVRVADGDTLTVRFDNGEEETIRLLDVDTPETVHPNRPEECFGA